MPASPCNDDSFEGFRKWVISTYGDGSKTKTVTWSKYLRIHKVLTGRCLAESPKFKFWVKTKGFCFLPCSKLSGKASEMSGFVIALPNKKTSVERVYKRVAVVEEFFDIIYDIHVNMEGKNGKHAGQKRTYRTIIESYAFLPREAVTHFLMSCAECRSRMHVNSESIPWSSSPLRLTASPLSIAASPLSTSSLTPDHCSSPATEPLSDTEDEGSLCIDIESSTDQFNTEEDSTMSSTIAEGSAVADAAVDVKGEVTASEAATTAQTDEVKTEIAADKQTSNIKASTDLSAKPVVPVEVVKNIKQIEEKEHMSAPPVIIKPTATQAEPKCAPEMPILSNPLKRTAMEASLNLSPTTSKKSSDDAEDDDIDDDDDDEKLSTSCTSDIDPERLKAFNMFCRLFVDENLDRLVPISKQPKEKVQAILDACDRQFPEFHDRSRKRIRTYLKSCRRMRRAREMNGWESFRPTPPHLTSPIAESLLSQACENEAQNAKRMRMGLEPISTTPPVKPIQPASSISAQHKASSVAVSMPSLVPASMGQAPSQAAAAAAAAHRMFPDWRFQHTPPFRPDLTPFFSNGFLRPPFPGFHAPLPAAAALQASQAANQLAMQQGGGDLSAALKKQASTSQSAAVAAAAASAGKSSSSLTSSEISTIRQLISGYRESATFLYRSADELEQLISSHSG